MEVMPEFSMPTAMNPKHNRSSTSLATNNAQSGALGAAGFAANPIAKCAGPIVYLLTPMQTEKVSRK
jgi:hypothetical protein